MKILTARFYILPLIFLLIFCAINQSQKPPVDDETTTVDTLLLNIPVIVGDRNGRYINGLKKDNFYIVENGVKRPVDFFADDSAPMNVAILIDTSYSTKLILSDIKEAARDFIKVLRPEDKTLIASFDSKTTVWSGFTADKKKLIKSINKINSQGVSIMYDALYLLMKKYFAPLQGRKAVIVLTDGGVDGYVISESKLVKALAESDIMVYPLLFEFPYKNLQNSPPTFEMLQKFRSYGILRMSKFSLVTGGKVFHSGETNLKTAFQQIADELKKQYVIGFYPSDDKGDKSFRVGLQFDPNKFDSQNIVMRTKRVISFKPPPKKKSSSTN